MASGAPSNGLGFSKRVGLYQASDPQPEEQTCNEESQTITRLGWSLASFLQPCGYHDFKRQSPICCHDDMLTLSLNQAWRRAQRSAASPLHMCSLPQLQTSPRFSRPACMPSWVSAGTSHARPLRRCRAEASGAALGRKEKPTTSAPHRASPEEACTSDASERGGGLTLRKGGGLTWRNGGGLTSAPAASQRGRKAHWDE